METTIRRHVLISGRVQGVGYRASVLREVQGRAPGLCGYVRNLEDGRVEAVFQGERDAVLGIVAWCEQGPPGSRVDRLEVREETPVPGEASPFRISR